MARFPSAAEFEAKSDVREGDSFARFMSNEQTKLLVSMVPATNPPELMTTLLRAAFKCGVECGTGLMASMMLEGMLANRKGNQQ